MPKIRVYSNRFYPNRKSLHIQVPKKDRFMDNCLVLRLTIQPKRLIFFDLGEIFGSIQSDHVAGRVNTLTYRHSVNRYAVNHHNNLQITKTKTNLTDVINDPKAVEQGINDYLQFIDKLHASGIKFKDVY